MAKKSISAAGESSMPAACGHGATRAIRRGFSSQLRASSAACHRPRRRATQYSRRSEARSLGRLAPELLDRPVKPGDDSGERGRMAEAGGMDGSSWYAQTEVAAPERARLVQDADVDVCVIGGGLAGLTVAREIVRRGWSVAVLEAKRIAWNASGRNSGLVMPGYPANIEKVVERIGLPATRALWALSEAGVRYVRDTIAEIGMTGVVQGYGWLDVSKVDDREQTLARARLLS